MLIQSYIKKLLIVFLVVFGATGFLVASASNSRAQNTSLTNAPAGNSEEGEVYYDPSNYQQWKDNFKETPVEDMAFRKNKKGCAQKMAFTTVLIKKYKSGDGIEDISESPVLAPYMKDQYKLIQEKGVLQAQKDMMLDYQKCIKSSKAEKNLGDEYDLNMRYGACDKLNTILLGTVESIKNRQSMETVIRRYENAFPDLSETAYKDMKEPSLLISVLYQKAKGTQWDNENDKYESLYEQASQLVVACSM
jgi:hypothetical protein